MAEIRVPTLGESVTEATIGKWFKKAGDAVAVDEPLVELETDKVTIEVANGKPFEITAGQASFSISDRGDITIAGNNVAIKATQKVTVDANTDLAITSKTNLKLTANAKAQLTGNAAPTVAGNGMLELKGGMVKIN